MSLFARLALSFMASSGLCSQLSQMIRFARFASSLALPEVPGPAIPARLIVLPTREVPHLQPLVDPRSSPSDFILSFTHLEGLVPFLSIHVSVLFY